MKVKVEFTVEVSDEQRDAIGSGYDEPGHRATRAEVRSYFKERGTNGLVDLADQELSWGNND